MSLDVCLTADVCLKCGRGEEVYAGNITHNLCKMAEALGVFGAVWHPEDNGITRAAHLVGPLRKAVNMMMDNPARFMAFDAPNGWGTYDVFLGFLREYLDACEKHPEATVRADR